MDEFYEVLKWMIENPVPGFALLFVEYALIATAYHSNKMKWLSYLLIIPFGIQDAVVNIFVLTVIFLELPHEWLVTSRMQRWKAATSDQIPWRIRRGFAERVCRLLNKFDPGHC